MKKWLAAICAVLTIAGLTGCAPDAGVTAEPPVPQTTITAPAATLQPTPVSSPAPLAALAGITANQVRQICVYGDSQPDMPEEVYCTDADVPAMLGWLQGIMVSPAPNQAKTVPGDRKTYDVVLFDGTVVSISLSGNTLTTGGESHTYTAPEMPDAATPLRLVVDGESFPAGTETINYSILNEAGGEQVLLFIPTLGRATPSGWVMLDCEAGFCGVADPLNAERTDHELPIKEWFPDASTGVYRLSMLGYDDNGDPYMIADVFEIR